MVVTLLQNWLKYKCFIQFLAGCKLPFLFVFGSENSYNRYIYAIL